MFRGTYFVRAARSAGAQRPWGFGVSISLPHGGGATITTTKNKAIELID
jgi:hypothetical protein